MAKKVLNNLQLDVIKGDIYYLPFTLNRFDLILCLEVLEHLTFPEKVMEEVSIHFNGYCIFSVPNEPLFRLTRLLLFKQNIRKLGNHPEHINHWSRNKFSRLIRKYFIIDQIVTPFPWTIVLCHKKEK
jgi:2-polyprenyl-3-methyl-5-hydroxy-6-metoxy-1,4-benzoquinol methylase